MVKLKPKGGKKEGTEWLEGPRKPKKKVIPKPKTLPRTPPKRGR